MSALHKGKFSDPINLIYKAWLTEFKGILDISDSSEKLTALEKFFSKESGLQIETTANFIKASQAIMEVLRINKLQPK